MLHIHCIITRNKLTFSHSKSNPHFKWCANDSINTQKDFIYATLRLQFYWIFLSTKSLTFFCIDFLQEREKETHEYENEDVCIQKHFLSHHKLELIFFAGFTSCQMATPTPTSTWCASLIIIFLRTTYLCWSGTIYFFTYSQFMGKAINNLTLTMKCAFGMCRHDKNEWMKWENYLWRKFFVRKWRIGLLR